MNGRIKNKVAQLYLLEAVQDLPQLCFHTEGGLQRSPVDPILFTPCRRSCAAQKKKKKKTSQIVNFIKHHN